MAIYSNCGGRDFTAEWKNLNPNVELSASESHSNKNIKIAALLEACSTSPNIYDINLLKQYKAIITWNSKFYEKYKNILNIYLTKDFSYTWDYKEPCDRIDNFIDYNDKINGICLVSNLSNFFYNESLGGIGQKRLDTMVNIKGLVKHIYGGNQVGGDMYQGIIGEKDPRFIVVDTYGFRKQKLEKVNKYKFTLVFENCYHEFWSWDYITEKIWDAFKSKTVPIYYGCYNIEKRIPPELYIDYRQFKDDDELSKYLIDFPENQYKKMIENAYEFYIDTEPNFTKDFRKILRELQ